MIREASTRHGPRTCGCVAYYFYCLSWLASESRMRVQGDYEAWPLCPVCHGSGVDPRIPPTKLDHYLALERTMQGFEVADPHAAEATRVEMDHVWYALSDEDRSVLNARRLV